MHRSKLVVFALSLGVWCAAFTCEAPSFAPVLLPAVVVGCSSAQQRVERVDIAGLLGCIAVNKAAGASNEATALTCGTVLAEDIPGIIEAGKSIADLPDASSD